MLILGITNNDVAGACLVEDGKIIAAVHEERFTRIKGHKVWPTQSINFVLTTHKKKLSDIDILAYGWSAGFNADYCLELYADRLIEESIQRPQSLPFIKKRMMDELHNDKEKRVEFDNFAKDNGLKDKVCLIDHHDCHAWAAYLCSSFGRSLVLTADGRGDYRSLTIRSIRNGDEELLHSETSIDSLGYFYGRITHLLGFTANKHEGKVTGLAAHGNASVALPLMKKMIDLTDGKLRAFCGDYYQPSYNSYSDELIKEVAAFSKEDIAAAAQHHIESILVNMLKPCIEKTKLSRICLAGGIFGNVRVNQLIAEIDGVENIFVLPCMGDDGLALAAAVVAQYRATGQRPRWEGMALGPSYSDKLIDTIKGHYHVKKSSNLPTDVINLMKNNKIIAVMAGAMEFGPRALCQRSIIYPANDQKLNIWLNEKLNRTEFMPFAPVTTDNLAPLCFENWQPNHIASKYMTVTYNCTPLLAQKCPAVVHIDNTARPQVITKEQNAFMFDLIEQWYAKTGEPCLVNTSFNRHEEPIINTLDQSLLVLDEKIIHALIFNNKYLITLKE